MPEVSTIEPELNSLLTKLTAEIQNDQKEIEFRQKRMKRNEVLLNAVKGSLGVANATTRANGHATKADLLRAAVQHITKQRFTHADVMAELKRANPEVLITDKWLRTALWTASNVKHKLVKQVVTGTTSQAAEYEKLDKTNGSPCPPRSERTQKGDAI